MLELNNKYNICLLSKELCIEKIDEIVNLLKLIPNSNYTRDAILAEKKGERVLYGKWEHSLILMDRDEIVGILIGYEREKEENNLYRDNCFYINEIAISRKYKGKELGKHLLNYFIESVKEYKYLKGEIKIRIQTTNSKENRKVIELYRSVGFKKIGIKKYPLKEDIVLEIIK